MAGEKVALRVWGTGWLKYGVQTWGVDLQPSDTPVYEWVVAGQSAPGTTLDGQDFALWNTATQDYLVRGHQTWGVGLNWYSKTQQPTPTAPPPSGFRSFVAFNCTSGSRPLEMWVLDESANTGWVDKGRLEPQWSGTSCPATGQPFTFTPVSGHFYLVEGIDLDAPGCANEVGIGCDKSDSTFQGSTKGGIDTVTIG